MSPSPDERDTVPPPPLGSVQIPNLAELLEPEEGATDREYGLYFARLAREATRRPATLVLQKELIFAIAVAIAIDAGDHIVDMFFKFWRMSGHGP